MSHIKGMLHREHPLHVCIQKNPRLLKLVRLLTSKSEVSSGYYNIPV